MKNINKNINKICVGLISCLAIPGKIFGSSQGIGTVSCYDTLESRFQSALGKYSPLEDSIPWPAKEDIALLSTVMRLLRNNNDHHYIDWHGISKEEIEYLGRSFLNCFNRFNTLQKCFTAIFRKNIIHAFQAWAETHPGGIMEEFLRETIQNPLHPRKRISRIKLIRRMARGRIPQ
jgi:hypothetical protein